MAKRTRILVVGTDLHVLSKTYLALIHKDFTVEATDSIREIVPRLERFKPRLVVLHADANEYYNELVSYLGKKRLQVIWVAPEEQLHPFSLRRTEHLPPPLDMHLLYEKICEMLNLVEL
jgi:hypothetical protein